MNESSNHQAPACGYGAASQICGRVEAKRRRANTRYSLSQPHFLGRKEQKATKEGFQPSYLFSSFAFFSAKNR